MIPEFSLILTSESDATKVSQMNTAAAFWVEGMSDLGELPVIPMVGTPSMASAYNHALSEVVSPFVILAHRDAYLPARIGNYRAGKRLRERMENLDLAGFCGAASFTSPIWQSAAYSCYGGVVNVPPPQPNVARTPPAYCGWRTPAKVITGIRVLDGYCLVGRTSVFREIPFDMTLPPWHGYDVDISMAFSHAGKRVGIISDVFPFHESTQGFNSPAWPQCIAQLVKKWRGRADLIYPGVGESAAVLTAADPQILLELLERRVSALPETANAPI